MLHLSSRGKRSKTNRCTLRAIVIQIALFTLAFAAAVKAQGVEAPPVTSFRPDSSSLPKMDVPEFVVTGKAETELQKAEKPSVEIDSSYFQGKNIHGLDIDVLAGQSLTQGLGNSGGRPSLFARLSLGTYATTSYLVSGGGEVSDYQLNGSLSGDYTSGFMPYTIQRSFAVQGVVTKEFDLDQDTKTGNSLDLGYSRDSYFLYGSNFPDIDQLRTTNQFNLRIRSDITLGELPVMAGLKFDRFSSLDYSDGVQSTFGFNLGTSLQLPYGSLELNGDFEFGEHTISSAFTGPQPVSIPYVNSFSHSLYNINVGAAYSNGFDLVTYSVGLNYYQYTDDLSSTIAKLYPDLRGVYRLNDRVSLFGRFYGAVRSQNLSEIFSTDRYVDNSLALRNTQDYADFTIGGNVALSSEVSVTPDVRIQALRYYPVFQTAPNLFTPDNQLDYANKATIFTTSVTAKYKRDQFSADAVLNLRLDSADSLSYIPNLSPFDLTLDAGYEISPQFLASASLVFLSGRHSDLLSDEKLDPSWLLNLRLSYDLQIQQIPLEIFAEGKNLLDQKYFIWQGYREFPFTLSIGISSRIL